MFPGVAQLQEMWPGLHQRILTRRKALIAKAELERNIDFDALDGLRRCGRRQPYDHEHN